MLAAGRRRRLDRARDMAHDIASHIERAIRMGIMKTTVEISDPLLDQVRKLAAREGVAMRDLVERGLRRMVDERQRALRSSCAGRASKKRDCEPRFAMRHGRRSASAERSEVLSNQPSSLGDAGHHARPDFLGVVKGEDVIRPALPLQRSMRPGSALFCPSDPLEGPQNSAGLGSRPSCHAAESKPLASRGTGSPCSIRSAMTLSASTRAFNRASASVAP